MEICNEHDIDVPDMDAPYVQGKKPRWHATTSSVSNLQSMIVFLDFDVKKLLRVVELYPNDFVDVSEVVVQHQL